ncbi:type II toxin-antitoxin system death-on-curing family toxin [Anabaena sp. UHCC 0399]|uniref:type II toxin-antitoxin system death-on-curing family toxin n=1 Tax=Anabaena sp. UHCC 0399 TaxID=3110238 RepID=UPI002B21134A|nr:type II toxin-antitoxin system death-on-curing family toxin [Anabaena sp. UHCC 0399]MEA5566242.1 type II toxin-antitoxin system death-on-curing family toxin [Anabaena sp. UHCC 0399]
MMRYLSLLEVLHLHRQIVEQSGGKLGVRDLGGLESAIAQPRMTFGGEDLYPSVIDKAVALGFSIIMNHPFVDGNKRTGQAAMETFMILNGIEISAAVDEQEQIILAVASGNLGRDALVEWLRLHTID